MIRVPATKLKSNLYECLQQNSKLSNSKMQISETNEIVFPVPMYKADTTKLTLECINQNEQNGLYDRDISIQRQEQRTTEEKEVFQAGIMNSILCGFKIPPVIINSKCDEKGKCVYRIIDGAHRMRAIIAYLKG